MQLVVFEVAQANIELFWSVFIFSLNCKLDSPSLFVISSYFSAVWPSLHLTFCVLFRPFLCSSRLLFSHPILASAFLAVSAIFSYPSSPSVYTFRYQSTVDHRHIIAPFVLLKYLHLHLICTALTICQQSSSPPTSVPFSSLPPSPFNWTTLTNWFVWLLQALHRRCSKVGLALSRNQSPQLSTHRILSIFAILGFFFAWFLQWRLPRLSN